VYWKPVYYLLEDALTVQLFNAAHMRNVPGRKTDVSDSAWIARLVEHGLVRPSFVPPPEIRRLRDFTRYRASLVAERTREKQRLDKVVEDAGIKLSAFVADIFGVSGRLMLHALIDGERDPQVLAELARSRMRGTIPALVEALTGRFDEHTRSSPRRCWPASTPWTRASTMSPPASRLRSRRCNRSLTAWTRSPA
jgi:transposase